MKLAPILGSDKPRVRPAKSKLYNLSAWRRAHGFRAALLVQNPICQRIQFGQQCQRAATVVHHLIDPAVDPTRFFDSQNVVCLCVGCHPGGMLGTADWKEGKDFVPTKWIAPRV